MTNVQASTIPTMWAFGFTDELGAQLVALLAKKYRLGSLVWVSYTTPKLGRTIEADVEFLNTVRITANPVLLAPREQFSLALWQEVRRPGASCRDELVMLQRERHVAGLAEIFRQPAELVRRIHELRAGWRLKAVRERPNIVLFSGTPHRAAEFIAFRTVKELGIPTIMMRELQVHRTLFISDDFRNPVVSREALSEAKPVSLDKLPQRIQHETDVRVSQQHPSYMISDRRGLELLSRGRGKIEELVRPEWRLKRDEDTRWTERLRSLSSFAERRIVSLEAKRFERRNFAHSVEQVEAIADGRKLVYCPLHLQPERTTSPEGGIFVDQRLMLQLVSDACPSDEVLLVVKRNPKQMAHFEQPGLWPFVLKSKKMIAVSSAVSTFDLLNRCSGVITVTGTAGWEALFLDRPVLAFGYPFYENAPGVDVVGDSSDTRQIEMWFESLRNNTSRDRMPIRPDMLRYLSALSEATVEAMWASSAGTMIPGSVEWKKNLNILMTALGSHFDSRLRQA